MGMGGMEENKKSGGGDVRAVALAWDGEWEKAENVFFALSLSLPRWLAVLATHIPRRPKKKPLRGKKTAAMARWTASYVSWVVCPYLLILATTDLVFP